MSAMMSSATHLPPAYYQRFASESRAVTVDVPGEMEQSEEEKLLAEARQQTYDLQSLTAGWNGYDALPPSAPSIRQAMHWVVRSYAECKDAGVAWFKPNITASAEGEVVFEWWAGDRSLIVYIEETAATFHKSLDRDGGPTEHTYGEAPLGESQAELLRWFGE